MKQGSKSAAFDATGVGINSNQSSIQDRCRSWDWSAFARSGAETGRAVGAFWMWNDTKINTLFHLKKIDPNQPHGNSQERRTLPDICQVTIPSKHRPLHQSRREFGVLVPSSRLIQISPTSLLTMQI